jgi:hypothetical protein
MTDQERALADEGIERIKAAILRGVANGRPIDESTNAHVDAVFATWPKAAAVMAARIAELTQGGTR